MKLTTFILLVVLHLILANSQKLLKHPNQKINKPIPNVHLKRSEYTVDRRVENSPIKNYGRYYLQNSDNQDISGWADINISISQDIVTGLIQITKQTSAKFQVSKTTPKHPINQDTRTNSFTNKTELRHYAIPLPLINYGIIPQTWQQTFYPDQNGYYGDNDPLDIIDISERKRQMFDISRYKILGAFCLIDQGQLDWKVLAIDPVQSLVRDINSYEDIPKYRLDEIVNWFKIYKTYDGKPQNVIGFGGKIFDKYQTLKLIQDTHEQFNKLRQGFDERYQAKKKEFYL